MAKKDLLKIGDDLKQKEKNETAAKKWSLVDVYSKWLEESEKNKKLENTDLTPEVPVATLPNPSTYTPYQGTATPTTDTGTGTNDYTKWTDGATDTVPTKTPTPTDTEGGYTQWAPVDVDTKTETKTETEPVVPESEQKVEGELNGEGKVETEESGFAKWLASDPTMQQRMKQAEADFYKNRAGYGVSGETLAQSGLIGSGWSSAMDAAAYSAMQAEKAGIRSEGYAKWLNEGGDATANGKISATGSEIFQTMLDNGFTEMTDAYRAQLTALGYSQSAIEEADKALKDYLDKSKAETGANIQEQLGKLSEGESVENVLSALGVNTSGMDADTIGTTFGNYLDQAFEEGFITAEERSKYLTDDALKDIEALDVDADNKTLASTAAGIVDTATKLKDTLTEADYKNLIDSAFDTLNVRKIELGKEGMPADEVRITVQDADGNTKTIVADWTSNPKDSLEKELTKLFGSASLAVYDDKIYYQYTSGGWREIDVKVGPTFLGGSQGSQSYGIKVLKTVAQYISDNKIDYRAKLTISEDDLEGVLDEDVLAKIGDVTNTRTSTNKAIANMVNDVDKYGLYNESARRKYIDGRMTRDEFIKDVAYSIRDKKYYAMDENRAKALATLYVKFLDESLNNK